VSISGTSFSWGCPLNNQSQIFGNVEAFGAGNLTYGIWESDIKGKASMRAAVQDCETWKRIISIFVNDNVLSFLEHSRSRYFLEAKSAL
jgi:hypothetical protein